MRLLARTTLASTLLFACGDNGDMQITQTQPTSLDTGGSTDAASAPLTSTDPVTTGTPTTTPAGEATTDEQTTDALTTSPTTDATTQPTTDATTTGANSDGSSGGGEDMNLMKIHGSACATDDDCKALLGADGICQKDILGIYALPGGYCTTYCQLPDQQTTYQTDSAFCTMMADCVGLMGFFEACAHECTDNIQCPRAGYECRQMPQISNPGDPKFCLMTEDNMIPP